MAKKNGGDDWLDAYDKDKGWKTGETPKGGTWGENGKGLRCYHSHPALKITVEGTDFYVYGGSCSTPAVDDCDIYIGLDYTMKEHPQRFPWEPGHAIHFRIQDMNAPSNPSEFKRLILWLSERVLAGERVHVGCIGGHGRTGTVLSALVANLTGEKDAIQYVRSNYCEKAVESAKQVEFLMTHYGVSKVEPAKTYLSSGSSSKVTSIDRNSVTPVTAKHCIWGDKIRPGG